MATIDEVMSNFNKKFKEELVHNGLAEYDYQRVPFTSPRLNYMTFGGLALGRLYEFFGEQHGGKTTSSLDIVANFQQMFTDKKVLWVDAENTLDADWAKKLGVKVDELLIVNPTNQGAEDIFQFILDMIETGQVGLFVIDSLGVMVSNQAMEKSVDEKTYGGIAMALTNFSKKAVGLCKRTNCIGIGINQMRANMNSPYGGTITTGGMSWAHNVSARLEFRKGNYIDADGKELTRSASEPSGNYVMVSMAKNKTCPPTRRNGFYTLRYDSGIDYLADLVEVAIKYGIVDKAGAWFTVVDTETGEALSPKVQGQTKINEFLGNDENVAVLQRVEELIDRHIKYN